MPQCHGQHVQHMVFALQMEQQGKGSPTELLLHELWAENPPFMGDYESWRPMPPRVPPAALFSLGEQNTDDTACKVTSMGQEELNPLQAAPCSLCSPPLLQCVVKHTDHQL